MENSLRSVLAAALVAAGFLVLPGCNSDEPQTAPQGKMSGGMIAKDKVGDTEKDKMTGVGKDKMNSMEENKVGGMEKGKMEAEPK